MGGDARGPGHPGRTRSVAVRGGRWTDVEEALGTRLPRDYIDLIGDGLACTLDEELVIASPFDPNPSLNLIRTAARSAWILASLREGDPDFSVAVSPEPGGLLGWGYDGGGGMYQWETSNDDPDRWTVAVTGRSVFDPDVQRHHLSLTAYLDALASGEIRAAALTGWPAPNARIERRAPPPAP
jgi:hypothetical protein